MRGTESFPRFSSIIWSFAWVLRKEIFLFDPFFTLDFLSIRFIMPECILSNFLNFEIKINVNFRSGSPTVSRGHVHSCGVCRFVSCLVRFFHLAVSFEVPCTPSLRIRCCCQFAFQRNYGSWPCGCEPSKHYSISSLRNHSVNAISWPKIMGDDRKWLRLPELQSLILCSG